MGFITFVENGIVNSNFQLVVIYLLPTSSSKNEVYQSAQVIEAGCVFTGDQTIEFKAGESITLDKGFYIGVNVDFSATIEDCE